MVIASKEGEEIAAVAAAQHEQHVAERLELMAEKEAASNRASDAEKELLKVQAELKSWVSLVHDEPARQKAMLPAHAQVQTTEETAAADTLVLDNASAVRVHMSAPTTHISPAPPPVSRSPSESSITAVHEEAMHDEMMADQAATKAREAAEAEAADEASPASHVPDNVDALSALVASTLETTNNDAELMATVDALLAAQTMPPVWKDEKLITKCEGELCGHQAFHVFNRKHHCRACGGVFCGRCTATLEQLSSDPTPQRVCTTCATP